MKFEFFDILTMGSIGMLSTIVGDILQLRTLRICGLIVLSIVFITNSKTLLRRIERLEKKREK